MVTYDIKYIYRILKNKKVLNYRFKNDDDSYIYIDLEDNNTLVLYAEGDCCSWSIFFDVNLDSIIGYYIKNIEEYYNDDDNDFSKDRLDKLYEYMTDDLKNNCLNTHKYIIRFNEDNEDKITYNVYFGLANMSNGYYDGTLNISLIENDLKICQNTEPDPETEFQFNLNENYKCSNFNNLHLSVINGDIRSVKRLIIIKDIEYINSQTSSGHTAIMLAVINNKLEIFKELLRFKDIDLLKTTVSGFTALNLACYYNLSEFIPLLCNINSYSIPNKKGNTPILNSGLDSIKILLEKLKLDESDVKTKEIYHIFNLLLNKE